MKPRPRPPRSPGHDAGLPAYPVRSASLPARDESDPRFEVRFATTRADLERILRLRFEVFNVELGEGLDASWATRRDVDRFDAGCHHLMVTDRRDGALVGTYRLQSSTMAATHAGFYSAGEFDLSELPEEVVSSCVELSRACIARPFRNRRVLFLLWKGLARYMIECRRTKLFGCCSLTSQDTEEGRRTMRYLVERGHVHPTLAIRPRPGFECYPEGEDLGPFRRLQLPPLFRAYLRYGARVCSAPAIDREFKTIDFLVLLDMEANGAIRSFLPGSGS